MDPQPAFISYPDRLRSAVAADPDKIAIIDGGECLTYRELAVALEQFSGFLRAANIPSNSCIALCGHNSAAYAVAYLGGVASGMVIAPLPHSATTASLSAMIADCGAALVIADSDSRTRLEETGLEIPILAMEQLRERLASAPTAPDEAIPVTPDKAFNIIYSSGTTGVPKGIVQSHLMRHAHVELARACGYDRTSVTLVSTPLYSNTTLVSFLPTLALGGTAVLMAKFDVERFLTLSSIHRVSHAMLVPVQYRRLMAHENFANHDLSAYREKFCTSAPFPADLKREILDRWPGGLTEYYGMTEGGGLTILRADRHPDKLHTVGRPAPDTDMRIIDEDGAEMPAGAMGEIVGRSRSMMQSYHNRPEETEAAFWTSPEGHRFMRTGDLGRFDEDGFLILMDRKKDLIISGGFNIYPSDLEEVIRRHPGVLDVAVVGCPSQEWGETPVAFVIAPDAAPDDICRYANGLLGKHQRLSGVRKLETLPRNAIGKVLKRQLRDAFVTAETGLSPES